MVEPLDFLIDRIATPIGELIIIADREGRLRTIDWTDHEARMTLLLDRYYGKGGYTLTPKRDPGGLSSAMRRYFKGEIGVLSDLPVATTGTPFQNSVWQALRKIEAAPRSPMPSSPAASTSPGRYGRRAWPTGRTRSASSCPATG